jgi:hypothetical protein
MQHDSRAYRRRYVALLPHVHGQADARGGAQLVAAVGADPSIMGRASLRARDML